MLTLFSVISIAFMSYIVYKQDIRRSLDSMPDKYMIYAIGFELLNYLRSFIYMIHI